MCGMVQPGDRARFLFEAAQPIGLRGELRRQDLDRDIATQSAVARTIDLTHPSRAIDRDRSHRDRGESRSRASRFWFPVHDHPDRSGTVSPCKRAHEKPLPVGRHDVLGSAGSRTYDVADACAEEDHGYAGVRDCPFADRSMGTAISFPSSAM